MMHMMNQIAMRSQMAAGGFSGTRQGVITAYDPVEYAIKVALQPTGEETGWIPLGTPWAGNGWGLAAGPMIDAEVQIDFDSGQIGVQMAGNQFYNNVDRCPGPPSGEFWIVHQSGSLLKFLNTGEILVSSGLRLTYTAPQHHFTDGDVLIDQNLTVVGNISDLNGAHGNIQAIRTTYSGHTHRENGQGSNTNQPNQQIS